MTDKELQIWLDGLSIDYGTPEQNRHQAITDMLDYNVRVAIREYNVHALDPTYVEDQTERDIDRWEGGFR